MKLTIKKENLLFLVNAAKGVTKKGGPNDVFENIYVKATMEGLGGNIHIKATDGDLSIALSSPANVSEEGEIIINASSLATYISKLPDADIVMETIEGNKLKVVCKKSRTSIALGIVEDFPKIAETEKQASFTLEQEKLKDMIKRTSYAVAIDQTRPILTGTLFEVAEGVFSLVSLDGYRLAHTAAILGEGFEELKINKVVPGRALTEVSKLLSKGKVEISFNDTHVTFSMDDIKFTGRLLEGEFVNYNAIIPQEGTTVLKVDPKELESALERASVFSSDGKTNLVKLIISKEEIVATSANQQGSTCEGCTITSFEGNTLDIAFNTRYLIDALKVVTAKEVTLQLTVPTAAAVIQSPEDTYRALALPVRLNS